jgi:hypothetical protein
MVVRYGDARPKPWAGLRHLNEHSLSIALSEDPK